MGRRPGRTVRHMLRSAGKNWMVSQQILNVRVSRWHPSSAQVLQSCEIVRVAEEIDVSLIMIARYGQSDYFKNIPIGSVAAGVAMHAGRPLFIVNPSIGLNVLVKELGVREFALAEQIWLGYHQQTADPKTDRVFGVFIEDNLVAAARCRRYPDGLEVDAVYTPEEYRVQGYA